MENFTANSILAACDRAGIAVRWEWTGGPCRALLIYRGSDPSGPCVRITGEHDPFTEGDRTADLTGHLMFAAYDHEDDEGARALYSTRVTSAADVLAATAQMLGRPDVEPAAEEPQEHMVAVVFDVTGAASSEDAATIVRDALRMHEGAHFNAALAQVNTDSRYVESWWFPETPDKHVDGNDRPAASLVFDDK